VSAEAGARKAISICRNVSTPTAAAQRIAVRPARHIHARCAPANMRPEYEARDDPRTHKNGTYAPS
jgi:hypothetical protein